MAARRNQYAACRRRGLTLLEVLLVLCIIAAIAAMAWPMLTGPFENQRLLQAAEKIRAHWTEARVEAMSTGNAQVFRCALGGEKYYVEQAADELDESSEEGTSSDEPKETLAETLPKLVTFLDLEISGQTSVGDEAATAELESDRDLPAAGQQWSSPVYFYADGTTSDARLVLKNDSGRCVDVSLRGLTGVVSIGTPYSSEDDNE